MADKLVTYKKNDPLVQELLKQVTTKFLRSEDVRIGIEDYSELSKEITKITKTKIDDRTLKEYFGYYKIRSENCDTRLLNVFAVYAGYENFYAFKKEEEINIGKRDELKPPIKPQDVPSADRYNIKKKKYIIISSTALSITLIGLIFFIQLNHKPTEIKKDEPRTIENPLKIAVDSIQRINEKPKELNNVKEEKPEILKLAENKKNKPAEETDVYLNDLIAKFDVALLIINENKQQENEMMSQIATFYRNQGYSVTYSLFTRKFIQSEYLPELQNANSQVINMLKIDTLIQTIIIGEVTCSFRDGTLVAGTIICNATIKLNMISVIQKSLVNSFSISVNGNGVSELQAKEHAFSKLFDKFKEKYSSL